MKAGDVGTRTSGPAGGAAGNDLRADRWDSSEESSQHNHRGFLVRRWGVLVIVLITVLAGLLVTNGALFSVYQGQSHHATDRVTAVRTAERSVLNLVTIDAANAKKQVDKLLEDATGKFRNQLSNFSDIFRAVLKEGKVSSDGTVTGSGVKELTDDRAVVLVSVTGKVSNAEIPKGAKRQYRIEVTLQHDGDSWLVSAMNFIG